MKIQPWQVAGVLIVALAFWLANTTPASDIAADIAFVVLLAVGVATYAHEPYRPVALAINNAAAPSTKEKTWKEATFVGGPFDGHTVVVDVTETWPAEIGFAYTRNGSKVRCAYRATDASGRYTLAGEEIVP